MRATTLLLGLLAFAGVITPPAGAAPLLRPAALTADRAVARTCQARMLPTGAAGAVLRNATTSANGLVRARLTGDRRADWDLAVFDAATGELVAASAHFASNELAEGIVAAGRPLRIQACRRSGRSTPVALSVDNLPLEPGLTDRIRLARVQTPVRAAKDLLVAAGFDLTEHGGRDYLDVLLHGEADLARLRASGLSFAIRIDDVVAADRAAVAARADDGPPDGPMPSGRVDYRRLADFGADMKKLVADNPALVKPITLPLPTLEGRPVEGVEITKDVAVEDGKPIFLQLGVHHAREWPSGELPLEFAFELVDKFKAGDARVTGLLEKARVIVVPVVNSDGYNLSRESVVDTYSVMTDVGFAYKRKNCRIQDGLVPAAGECGQDSNRDGGVDPNRNYGQFWGGGGSSGNPGSDTYRGAAPFSEPETQNIQRLVATRQVTTLITNHTYSDLILRPPGLASQGPTPDEPVYKALGDAMAAENGYTSQLGYELYDTTGTTEDWSYHATGGLGFTFEIGPGEGANVTGTAVTGSGFHPPYSIGVILEWFGKTPTGGGNREAYYLALESAASAERHSILTGSGPPGARIRLRKSFDTLSSRTATDGVAQTYATKDALDTRMTIPAAGEFEYHVNPSTRPITVKEDGAAEAWHLTCETFDGHVIGRSDVVVGRGERVALGNVCGGATEPIPTAENLRVRVVSLGRLSRILPVAIACSRVCTARLRLTVDRRTRKALRLRNATVARLTRRDIGEQTALRLTLARRTAAKLRRARNPKLVLTISAASDDGGRAVVTRRVKLRR